MPIPTKEMTLPANEKTTSSQPAEPTEVAITRRTNEDEWTIPLGLTEPSPLGLTCARLVLILR